MTLQIAAGSLSGGTVSIHPLDGAFPGKPVGFGHPGYPFDRQPDRVVGKVGELV
jgi:hypothetical protein